MSNIDDKVAAFDDDEFLREMRRLDEKHADFRRFIQLIRYSLWQAASFAGLELSAQRLNDPAVGEILELLVAKMSCRSAQDEQAGQYINLLDTLHMNLLASWRIVNALDRLIQRRTDPKCKSEEIDL